MHISVNLNHMGEPAHIQAATWKVLQTAKQQWYYVAKLANASATL